MRAQPFALLSALLLFVQAAAAPLAAQTATLAGEVVDGESGTPLGGATVQVFASGGEEAGGVLTESDGRFRISLAPGTYSVTVIYLGYETARLVEDVTAGETETVSVTLVPRALELNPIVASVSRREEKALEAPAAVSVVETEEIQERAAQTAVDHIEGLPGVDASTTGIQQANVVTRGFNNVFSGAMLVIQDNRYARVPSLNVNVYSFIPTTNLDLERIEVALGPGAALYGPNAASGVLHLITASSIDAPGTRFSLAGGERSLLHGEFRHATRFSEKAGLKVSGQYFRASDWRFTDPVEAVARGDALTTDPDTQIGLRDFDAERWSGDVRFDLRPWEDGEIVFAGGVNLGINLIELTGVGAAQARDWRYSYGQVRLSKGRLFAQAFGNFSDAGDSYLLRTGQSVVDESRFLAAQVQHGFALGSRADFIYGVDAQRTEPRTEGTITGRHEDDDTIDEVGGYIHSETMLLERLDFVGAARIDWHNRLEDPVFSPRAALVFEPVDDQNLRFTFNRAFSTPTTNNLFLDLVVGGIPIAPGVGYDIRTLGTPESGFTFDERCAGGVGGGLCMRSPFAPGQALPANAAVAFNTLLTALAPPDLQPFLPLLLTDSPNVGTVLRRFDQEVLTFVEDPIGPVAIQRLEPTITNTIELGYKGLLGNRVLLAADVYRSDIENFIGPLRVETPTVFLDPLSTAAFIQERLTPLVQSGQLTPQQLAGIVQQLTTNLARVPIGTVAPDQNPSSDILLAYRNFGELDLWGADFAAEVLLTDRLSLKGALSFVSDDCFDFDGDGNCRSAFDIALNAPETKGSFGVAYDHDEAGLTLEGRVRSTSSFPMNSGVYVGEVDGYTVFDANIGYRLPLLPGALATLTATNLFDDEHREFVGAPELGRLIVLRLQYELP